MTHVLAKFTKMLASFLIYAFVLLTMLLLGRESRAMQVDLRVWVLVFPAVVLLGRFLLKVSSFRQVPPIFIPFFCFWIFEGVRYLLPWAGIHVEPEFAERYRDSFIRTSEYFLIFSVFFVFCQQKRRVLRTAALLGHSGYLLAMIAMIPLLLSSTHEPIYDMAQWRTDCFWPLRISEKWIHNYFLPPFAHVNILGDILMVGFFALAGLILYALSVSASNSNEAETRSREARRRWLTDLIFKIMQSAVILGAVLLLYSRGTILALSFSILVFLVFLYFRFKRNIYIGLIFGIVISLFFTAAWIGNGSKAFKETLTAFQEDGEGGSSVTNKRGKEIALKIYQAYPVWGVGLRGYSVFAQKVDTNWKETDPAEAYHRSPLNHYLLMLSESGAGAFFWFSFIVVWLLQTGYRIIVTKSRLKFALGLCGLCAVLTILTHSIVGFLMQYYATSSLVYAVMGMTSGLLGSHFKYEK